MEATQPWNFPFPTIGNNTEDEQNCEIGATLASLDTVSRNYIQLPIRYLFLKRRTSQTKMLISLCFKPITKNHQAHEHEEWQEVKFNHNKKLHISVISQYLQMWRWCDPEECTLCWHQHFQQSTIKSHDLIKRHNLTYH